MDREKRHQRSRKFGLYTQLILLEIGGLINDVTLSGYGWHGLRRQLHREKYREQTRLYQALHRLEKQGLIERQGIQLNEGLVLTDTGRRVIKQLTAEQLISPKLQRWDGKWRLIIFDIPEHHRLGRDLLRRRLYQLGCKQIQKSVFLYPYDLRPIIEQIREAYDLQTDLIYLLAESIDGADNLQKYFEESGILPKPGDS